MVLIIISVIEIIETVIRTAEIGIAWRNASLYDDTTKNIVCGDGGEYGICSVPIIDGDTDIFYPVVVGANTVYVKKGVGDER
jgi:hypothetical protein